MRVCIANKQSIRGLGFPKLNPYQELAVTCLSVSNWQWKVIGLWFSLLSSVFDLTMRCDQAPGPQSVVDLGPALMRYYIALIM